MEHFSACKLEIFLPETHLVPLHKALQETGGCLTPLSYSPVTGCWRPLAGASPYLGRAGEISSEPELKAETACQIEQVDQIVAAVKAVHPYEEPVINVIPLYQI